MRIGERYFFWPYGAKLPSEVFWVSSVTISGVDLLFEGVAGGDGSDKVIRGNLFEDYLVQSTPLGEEMVQGNFVPVGDLVPATMVSSSVRDLMFYVELLTLAEGTPRSLLGRFSRRRVHPFLSWVKNVSTAFLWVGPRSGFSCPNPSLGKVGNPWKSSPNATG